MNTTTIILYLLLTNNINVMGDASLYFDCSDEYIQIVTEVQPDEGLDPESDLGEEDLHIEPWMSAPFTSQPINRKSDQK